MVLSLTRIATTCALLITTPALADPFLAGFDYGWAVNFQTIISQKQALRMAYIDVKPKQANGHTAVLLHGKNFCAGTWETTIKSLSDAGYRVIAPDQVGFCKSSKPMVYQYGLNTLAANTHALLTELKVTHPIMIGHSMGGMLAMRYALQYPTSLERLVLVNPIGLEDWRAKGVPNATIDELYTKELKTTKESIKSYQRATYYNNTWKPQYDRWVNMLESMYEGLGNEIVSWNQAQTYDMIFNQPVIHEISNIHVPTVLMIGLKDNTAIGKERADIELARTLGNYPQLAKNAVEQIPNSRLITYANYGHAPQIQDPDKFNVDLLEAIKTD
ncbi:alpha/beta fold hydrolase [Ochrobactrum sp. EDr1-4]|uniref:alpha/beta fold hydrolase n=1 Tax=Ochrobactrum sp. EDr1-4 TaxID=3368622 RepID=UPI003B9E1428